MCRKLAMLLMIVISSACVKNQPKTGCGTQICTKIFVSTSVHFTDNKGQPVAVQNFSATNQRTHLKLMRTIPQNEMLVLGYYIVANDSMLDQLSTDGDDILLTATYPATNQTKTAIVKVSGGCNCHVAKLSGPDIIAFD